MLIHRHNLRVAALLTAALTLCAAAVAAPTQIQDVRIATGDDRTRVALDLSRAATHKLFTLSNPSRVVIDIKPGRIVKQALPLPAGQGAVSRIRSANRRDGSVRIVLDLKDSIKPESFLLAADGARRDRLVIDLFPADASVPVTARVNKQPVLKPAAPAAAPSTVVKEMFTPPAVKPTVTRKLPAGGRDIVIAVDAGHGGKDPGARGPTGAREKDVVLRISKRLAEAINAEPGMRAVLTRDKDQFVHLRQRIERGRSAGADLFVSIHADAFRDRRVRGATVYVLSGKGVTDEAARRLAARENAAVLIGGVDLGNKDKMLASVLLDLSQNASLSASFAVGEEIIGEMGQVTKLRKRKVQQAPFLVLKSPDVPSVLIETAFISNPADERNLASSQYQAKMARVIFSGIRDYFYTNPPPGTRVAALARSGYRAQSAYVIRRGDTLSNIADQYNVSVRRIRSENHLKNDRIRVGQVLKIPASQDI
jgi:N-acetylmuramoyl-L-alanine amidase